MKQVGTITTEFVSKYRNIPMESIYDKPRPDIKPRLNRYMLDKVYVPVFMSVGDNKIGRIAFNIMNSLIKMR